MLGHKSSSHSRLWYVLLPWLICGVGALFYCYEYFLRVTPSVMQPELMNTFGIDNAMFGALSALYYNAYTPMQLPVGMLMDRFGPRRLLTLACLICALGTYLFSIHVLSIAGTGRFLVGLGSAFAFVGVLKLATIWLPPQRFGMIAGLVTGLGMFGPIFGDLLLTPMVAKLGWHHTVELTAFLGVLLAIFTFFAVSDRHRRRGNSAHRLVGYEQVNFKSLFQGLLEMLGSRQVWLAGVIGCCLYLPIAIFAELWGIPYLEQARGFPPIHAAMINPLIFLGFALGGTMTGWISDTIVRRREPLIVSGVLALTTAVVLLYSTSLSVGAICFLIFLLGFFSGAEVIVFAVSRESVHHQSAGTALAMTNFLIMVGGMVFQPIIGLLLDKHAITTGHSVLVLNNADYRYALIVLPLALAVAIGLTFFLKETAGAEVK